VSALVWTEAMENLIAQAAIDVGGAACLGLMFGQWDDFDAAWENQHRVMAGALRAVSGAADELEYYGCES
jgi:hypothetical protein